MFISKEGKTRVSYSSFGLKDGNLDVFEVVISFVSHLGEN